MGVCTKVLTAKGVMVLANLAFEDLIVLVKLGALQHQDSAVRKSEILHMARTVGQTLAQELILLIHLPPNKTWSILLCLDPSGTQFPSINTLNSEQLLSSQIDHDTGLISLTLSHLSFEHWFIYLILRF